MGRKTYEEAKNVGDGEALSRKRKLCVFRQMQTDLTDAVVVDQDPVAFYHN